MFGLILHSILWKISRVTGTSGICCCTPQWVLTPFVALTLRGLGSWRMQGDGLAGARGCSVLARKDSQQLWHQNENLGVCQSFEGAHSPLSRGVGQGVHAHTPQGLPCLSRPSSPHCLTRGIFINCMQPLENRRAINSGEGENVWVWHIVCLPAFPNTQVSDQKFSFIGNKLHTNLWLTNVLPETSLLLVLQGLPHPLSIHSLQCWCAVAPWDTHLFEKDPGGASYFT